MNAFAPRSFRAALCALLACGLVACGKQEASPGTPAASAAAARALVVGTDAAYAPFESQNEKGEIVGFDIDVVKAVAQKAGLEVKFVNTPWEGIFNALKQGDRDLLVSSITITDERKQTMDFTAPYFDAHQLIAVRAVARGERGVRPPQLGFALDLRANHGPSLARRRRPANVGIGYTDCIIKL